MTILPFPAESRMRWRRLDLPGQEEARIERADDAWRLSGQVDLEEAGLVARLHYVVRCDEGWRTRSAIVEGLVGGESMRLALTSDGAGHWALDGAPMSGLAGALDIDLGFTPATNMLPIRRLALAIGESARVTSAWLRFPELRLESLDQTYTRQDEDRYRYVAIVDGHPFTARLVTDAFGRVICYEALWEAVPVSAG